MSACSSTIRALSRSRIPTKKTLLPFLYQTTTIQQWKPAAQPIARRNISRYSRRDDSSSEDIPFENKDDLPPALDDLEPVRKTTITGSERAAFEKLYRKFNTRGSRQNEKDHEVEIDAIADEYWEPDDEENPTDLDRIFDDALKGKPKPREWNRSREEQLKSGKSRQDLQTLAQHVLRGTRPADMVRAAKRAERKKDLSAKAAKLNEARMQERNRIDSLLKSAKTDRELWDILQREVFDLVRQLDLDGTSPKTKKPKNSKFKPASATTDPKILFANYPHHLLTALTTLRTHFPSSPLPLSILPTIKSLGRSSYALGATTALYTQLLRTAWLQQSSYPLLTSLMTDMHNGAIEFSVDTLNLLDQVVKEFDMARSGRLGREMQMVYGMEQFGESIKEVRRWRQIVASRVSVDEIRREKGTIPVSRRSSVDTVVAALGARVPLVEGRNDMPISEGGDAATKQEQEQVQAQAQAQAQEAAIEFGFLSDEGSAQPAETNELDSVVNKGAEKVEEKLKDRTKDDIMEEEGKTVDQSEATAKTSSGETMP